MYIHGIDFEDDKAIECDGCHKDIEPGENYAIYRHNGLIYKCCNTENCMASVLLKAHYDDFEDGYISTAEDKVNDWADRKGG